MKSKFKKKKSVTNSQKIILFMTISIFIINSFLIFLINNVMHDVMLDSEQKYLTEIIENISNSAHQTVFEYVALCEIATKNGVVAEIFRDSDKDNPMHTHEKARQIIIEMDNIVDSFSEYILCMGILDVEQDGYLLNTGQYSGNDYFFKDRPTYEAVLTKEYIVTEPYEDYITEDTIVSIAYPVIENDEVLGVVSLDVRVDFMSNLVLEHSYNSSGRSLVLDNSYTILAYSDPSYINSNYVTLNISGADFEHALVNSTGDIVQYEFMGETRLGLITEINGLNWKVVVGMDYSDFDKISKFCLSLLILSSIITFIICFYIISGKISSDFFKMHCVDSFTGLYNRNGFFNRIDEILEKQPKTLALIYVNINDLKELNKEQGFSQGNAHIQNVINKLNEYFDYEFFRMSGNELLGVAPNENHGLFEEKILALYEDMQTNNYFDFTLGHSFGKDKYDLLSLMQEAETAMKLNKLDNQI